MHTKTPSLAELIDTRIIELRRQGAITAKEIAKRAGIRETTLSMIRKGHRGVSPETALKVAGALELDDSRLQDVMTAAGYGPVSTNPTLRPIVEHLYTRDGFIETLRHLPSTATIWTFGVSLIETVDDAMLALFRENYDKGIHYLFFISQRNALDFVKLRDNLTLDGIQWDAGRANAIVLPDESFHHRDGRIIKCLVKDSQVTGYATNVIDGECLYREMASHEVGDLKYYLEQLEYRAVRQGEGTLPMSITAWLHQKGYNLGL